MGWVLRLVETETDSPGPGVDVMEIRPPRDLGDIAHLGLTLLEAKQLVARAAGGGRRASPPACGFAAGLLVLRRWMSHPGLAASSGRDAVRCCGGAAAAVSLRQLSA